MDITAKLLLYIIFIIISLNYLLSLCLTFLNWSNLSEKQPKELEGLYDDEKYKRSQQYEKDKSKLSLTSETFSFLISVSFLFYGGYGWLYEMVSYYTTDIIWGTLLFFGILVLASDILGLPFQLYGTFVLEEKYGFNRTTLKTFISDKLKGYVLGALLGGSLLALFIILYQALGADFWMYMLLVFALFMIVMNMFYASWILPLFNKLTPLPEGEVRTAIEAYCKKNNFGLSNLFVLDGSKRSAKANAFFSGMGSKKKIVLFDTLVNNYSTDELVAVLAHEVGHYKKKHTALGLILGLIQVAIMLFLLSRFINNSLFSEALGATEYSLSLSLIAFTLIYSPLSLVISLLMNWLSRKNEFEADAYARSTYKAEALISALKKLSTDSLSNLTPHPLYVFFYYSHPPLYERVKALNNN